MYWASLSVCFILYLSLLPSHYLPTMCHVNTIVRLIRTRVSSRLHDPKPFPTLHTCRLKLHIYFTPGLHMICREMMSRHMVFEMILSSKTNSKSFVFHCEITTSFPPLFVTKRTQGLPCMITY